jgi:hypothetical protein
VVLRLSPPTLVKLRLSIVEVVKSQLVRSKVTLSNVAHKVGHESVEQIFTNMRAQLYLAPRCSFEHHHQVTPCQPGSLCQSNNSTLVTKQHHQTLGEHCSPPAWQGLCRMWPRHNIHWTKTTARNGCSRTAPHMLLCSFHTKPLQ